MKKIMIITCLLAVSMWAMADGEDLEYKAYLDSIANVAKAEAEARLRQDSLVQDSIAKANAEREALAQARRNLARAYADSIQALADSTTQTPADSVAQTPADSAAVDSVPQLDRFTIGARAGGASLLQKMVNEDAKSQFGFDVILDLQYAHYWLTKKEHKLGLLTGLSVGFAQAGLKAPANTNEYTVTDPDGMKAHYTITAANVRERDRQVQLEVPLMFSLVSKQGVFFNFGPRFLLPVYTPYKENIDNADIDAYFEETDVHVTNEVITGLMKDDQLVGKGTTDNKLKLNITLGTELGYEWTFKNGHSLDLGAYANYGLYCMFKQDAQNLKSLITVTPAIPSIVTTNSATDAWTQKMGFVDVGVKLVYHFNWWKNHPRKHKE